MVVLLKSHEVEGVDILPLFLSWMWYHFNTSDLLKLNGSRPYQTVCHSCGKQLIWFCFYFYTVAQHIVLCSSTYM